MSDFTSIAAVTTTLRNLIEAEMNGVGVNDTESPAVLTLTQPTIGIFLYRVERNTFTSNFDWAPDAQGRLQAPPFGLNLHYLFTPYGPTLLEVQRTLGELMRVCHDRAVLRRGDPLLAPALAELTEELRIVPRSLPLAELLDLWRSFGERAFRLSVTYEVSAVLIDSDRRRDVHPVQERVLDLARLR